MNKSERHQQILKLIREGEISTQEQLASLLKSRGIETTQVTLSRDVRELGLVKTAQGYAEIGGTTPRFLSMAREFMTSAVAAQNLVVVKTSPGHAMSLAIALDTEEWPNVLGTIAGDDTIFVAMADAAKAREFAEELQRPVFGHATS
ncbi:arginine repressor [Bryobacter aggregatus]|uniref:arginine repressor n=1 Tax=Bryobacter aggregatus TaxID=360054 RepID=UPI0004E0DB99|nr:ArgR family transcriptional regulator [Bryobacter aggregatus]